MNMSYERYHEPLSQGMTGPGTPTTDVRNCDINYHRYLMRPEALAFLRVTSLPPGPPETRHISGNEGPLALVI